MEPEFAGQSLGIDLREEMEIPQMASAVNEARRQLRELMRLRLLQSHEAQKGQPEVAFEG